MDYNFIIATYRDYEMEFTSDCWQYDTSNGSIIAVNEQKKKTLLITFIDDAFRLILHDEFFFKDNDVNYVDCLKKIYFKIWHSKERIC